MSTYRGGADALPTYTNAVVIAPSGGRATLPVADENDWKDRYQWHYGVWPTDDRLVRIEPNS